MHSNYINSRITRIHYRAKLQNYVELGLIVSRGDTDVCILIQSLKSLVIRHDSTSILAVRAVRNTNCTYYK